MGTVVEIDKYRQAAAERVRQQWRDKAIAAHREVDAEKFGEVVVLRSAGPVEISK
jgi:hypothetical protein